MSRKEGLDPILNENTEILILGSLPSDESIKLQRYYAKSSNDFWKLISEVVNFDLTIMDYEDKITTLINNKIGLWDVFKESIREGSLDSNIKDEELNDFSKLKSISPNLRLICLNGKKAGKHEKLFKYEFKTIILPSSSGANRRNNEKRIEIWRSIV